MSGRESKLLFEVSVNERGRAFRFSEGGSIIVQVSQQLVKHIEAVSVRPRLSIFHSRGLAMTVVLPEFVSDAEESKTHDRQNSECQYACYGQIVFINVGGDRLVAGCQLQFPPIPVNARTEKNGYEAGDKAEKHRPDEVLSKSFFFFVGDHIFQMLFHNC